jgi:hypothetical protein
VATAGAATTGEYATVGGVTQVAHWAMSSASLVSSVAPSAADSIRVHLDKWVMFLPSRKKGRGDHAIRV